jgi:hypothetical protein
MTGTIASTKGYVGLGVTINPNGLPVDVSAYPAITFRARGDGRAYHLKIETAGVQDGDFHEIVIAPPTGVWRQYVIPFSRLRQRLGANPVPFTGTDVKAIVWAAEGPWPAPAVHLEIDRLAFFHSTVIGNITGPTTANNVFGLHTVTAPITDDVSIASATLHYSTNGGTTFSPVAMHSTGKTPAGDTGRAMGTRLNCYLRHR